MKLSSFQVGVFAPLWRVAAFGALSLALSQNAYAATCPVNTVNGNTLKWQINSETTATFDFTLQGSAVTQINVEIITRGPVTGDTLSNKARILNDGIGKSIAVYYYGVDTINGPTGSVKILGGGFVTQAGIPTFAIGAAAGVSPGASSDGWIYLMEGGVPQCLPFLENPAPRPFGDANAHDIVRVDASITQIPILWNALLQEKNALVNEVALLRSQLAALRSENDDLRAQLLALQNNILTIKSGTVFDLSRSAKVIGKLCTPLLRNADDKSLRKFRRLIKRTKLANGRNVSTAQTIGSFIKKPTRSDFR